MKAQVHVVRLMDLGEAVAAFRSRYYLLNSFATEIAEEGMEPVNVPRVKKGRATCFRCETGDNCWGFKLARCSPNK